MSKAAKFESVMLIDDNSIDLYINARIIANNNFAEKVLSFSSSEKALAYLIENQNNTINLPMVIFVDIHMPGMSGFEFMAVYDTLSVVLKNYCQIFIISSTIDSEDIKQASNDKNIRAFQEKPITKDFLDSIT